MLIPPPPPCIAFKLLLPKLSNSPDSQPCWPTYKINSDMSHIAGSGKFLPDINIYKLKLYMIFNVRKIKCKINDSTHYAHNSSI